MTVTGRFARAFAITIITGTFLISAGCGLTGRDAGLEGTEWRLAGGSAATFDPLAYPVTVSFEDGRIGGQAPVNSFGGTYSTGAGGSFATADIAQTLMAGSDEAMAAESAFFAALSAASEYRVEGDRLALLGGDGDELLVFDALR